MSKIKPEWATESNEFASHVISGVNQNSSINSNNSENFNTILKKNKINIDDYYNGILNKDISILAKAITLIESNSKKHYDIAQELLTKLLPHSGKSFRIGISGSPGAGKSTLIESFGLYLCNLGYKVAVLAIDPSSTISKGSILGDKTRMERLSRHKNSFIRPSPSSGSLGGVARKTRESIILCESAGYDIILIETVGVGQSEITVRSMVDFYLLVLLPLAGDDLQGIKKGTVEIADALVINKADGDNFLKANITKENYKQALHYLIPTNDFWTPEVLLCSALKETGIDNIWEMMSRYLNLAKQNGYFQQLRQLQAIEWFKHLIDEEIKSLFYNSSYVVDNFKEIQDKIINNEISPSKASKNLVHNFFNYFANSK